MSSYYSGTSSSFLMNTHKGWNTPADTTSGIIEDRQQFYSYYFLEYYHRKTHDCRKVVEFYPEKMVKGWGKPIFVGAKEKIESAAPVLKDLQKRMTKIKSRYQEGQIVANLYGDGYIVRYINDGRRLNQPINWKDIRDIKYSRVFDNIDVQPSLECNYYSSADYYNPEFYYFYTDQSVRVHRDRIIRFRGNYLPPKEFERNNYCHASLLESFIEPYIDHTQALKHVREAMTSFEFINIEIEDLLERLAHGTPAERAELNDRVKDVQTRLSSMRGLVSDKDAESVKIVERKFTSIRDILNDVFREEKIAASNLDESQLYNKHPAGMQATGEHEARTEAGKVLAMQENLWQMIEDDLTLHCLLIGANPSDFQWKWNSIYQSTKKEEYLNNKVKAETDKIYHDMGKSPEEKEQNQQLNQDEAEAFIVEGAVLSEAELADIDVESLQEIKNDSSIDV